MSKETKDTKVSDFSQTRLMTYMTCPRKEYYQFRIDGVGITSSTPESYFLEGEFGHYALMYFYRNKAMLKENMIKRIKKMIDRLGAITPEYDQDLRQDMAAMMGACNAYKQLYKKDFTKYKVLFVEQQFEVNIAGYTFKGKLDLGLEDLKDGTKGFVEHKFLSQFSIANFTNLPLNIQQLVYSLGFKQITGEYPTWYMWNIIKKSSLRRKGTKPAKGMAVAVPEHLLEFEARVLQQYMDEPEKMFFRPPPRMVEAEALKRVVEIVEAHMKQWEASLSKPPLMNLSACEGKYNTACTFAPACTAFMTGHKDGWNAPECTGMYKKKEDQHPELVEDEDDN
jgi:hypothetical protein